ncbi:hypothetical protein SAMN05444358_1011512 [Ruegeria halocynthiae]|uniref:DUF6455 domain-containing protein n=2 Tax=Ruegeria halocynthiae TaxID=985054 RepID=A0A1H2VKZ2_9RHOB|nr:hypothetical protein SAMN05444358_1011512 [Ruegeria halocynthiae]
MLPGQLGEIEEHFWLTRSVARCMGISLSEAMAENKLSPYDYAQMVTRCRGAACNEHCQIWLAAQQAQAATAPEFCVNAEVLNSLT